MDRINRTINLAKTADLAVFLIGDPGLPSFGIHSEYIRGTCGNACSTANAFVMIYVFYRHCIFLGYELVLSFRQIFHLVGEPLGISFFIGD